MRWVHKPAAEQLDIPPETRSTYERLDAAIAKTLEPARGRPRAAWHAEAFQEVQALIDGGHSEREACRLVEKKYERIHSLTPESLRKMWQRSAQSRLRDNVIDAILDRYGDLEITARALDALAKLRRRMARDPNVEKRLVKKRRTRPSTI